MFKLGLEKAEEQEIKLPASLDYRKSKRIPEKHHTSPSSTMLKPLTLWITTNWKILRDGNTTLPTYRETCMQVKKQWLEPDMEQQTGSKLGKEYIKAVYQGCRVHHEKCRAG